MLFEIFLTTGDITEEVKDTFGIEVKEITSYENKFRIHVIELNSMADLKLISEYFGVESIEVDFSEPKYDGLVVGSIEVRNDW